MKISQISAEKSRNRNLDLRVANALSSLKICVQIHQIMFCEFEANRTLLFHGDGSQQTIFATQQQH